MCDCSKDRVAPGCRIHDPTNSQTVARKSSVTPRKPSKQTQSEFTRSFFPGAPRPSTNQPGSQRSTSAASRPSTTQEQSGPQRSSSAPDHVNHQAQSGSQQSSSGGTRGPVNQGQTQRSSSAPNPAVSKHNLDLYHHLLLTVLQHSRVSLATNIKI